MAPAKKDAARTMTKAASLRMRATWAVRMCVRMGVYISDGNCTIAFPFDGVAA